MVCPCAALYQLHKLETDLFRNMRYTQIHHELVWKAAKKQWQVYSQQGLDQDPGRTAVYEGGGFAPGPPAPPKRPFTPETKTSLSRPQPTVPTNASYGRFMLDARGGAILLQVSS